LATVYPGAEAAQYFQVPATDTVGLQRVPDLIGIAQETRMLPFSGPASTIETKFTVSFSSAQAGQGMVFFGSGPGCNDLVEVATRDGGAGTTSHSVVVHGNDLPGTVGDNGLIPGATYWYEMVTMTSSGKLIDNNNGQCYQAAVFPSG
jgi:hypothetical protein